MKAISAVHISFCMKHWYSTVMIPIGEKILKTYASGATNVNYMYVDTKSGKVYTNIKDVTSSNYLKTLDKLTSGAGPFMLIAPDTQDCVLGFSNISDWTVSYWQNMLKNTGLAGENYLYFVFYCNFVPGISLNLKIVTMRLPEDPVMLYSFINMKLRDFYPSLDALCEDMNVEKEDIVRKLKLVGFEYNPAKNRFW